jgi:hypothetical protein
VIDATGAAVPQVHVIARSAASGNSRTTETGDSGSFLLTALPIGEYSLTFEKEGFTTATQNGVQVSVGQIATQRITLALAMVTQQLDVSASTDALQTTVADLVAARPDIYIQAFGNPATSMRTVPLGFWLQDRWQPFTGFTVEAGVRYDRQSMPGSIPVANRNLAPRLGVAWHPGANSAWAVRAGAGLFYDRYPLAYLNEAIQKNGTNGFEQFLAGPLALAAFQAALAGALPAAMPPTAAAFYRPSAQFPAYV